jgi:hypothetical protein
MMMRATSNIVDPRVVSGGQRRHRRRPSEPAEPPVDDDDDNSDCYNPIRAPGSFCHYVATVDVRTLGVARSRVVATSKFDCPLQITTPARWG